jgi:hypothetical protein
MLYIAAGPLALGIMLGGMGVFSFLVAPTAHRLLPKDQAATFTRAMFPRYYLFAGAAAAAAAVGLVGREPYMAMMMVVVAGVALLCRQVLSPMLDRARDAREAGDAAAGRRFALLHKVSAGLNMGMMGAAAVATVVHV